MKPEKIKYKNQREVLKKFLNFIEPFLKKYGNEIKEAYLWGSLVEGTFGLYKKEYMGQIGSDVDLVVFLKKDSDIPSEWKSLNTKKSWFSLYKEKDFRVFRYMKNPHKVDLIVVNKNKTPPINKDFKRVR
ncbi:nucleotidyltransferase domain-containing protein [Candidatus Pacearchaeota archaeon]|nr:nucleotidyltransferase domain-containing protein [Candidatus Pacearchaeota archaeon]